MDYKQIDDGNLSLAFIITVLVSTVQYTSVSHCMCLEAKRKLIRTATSRFVYATAVLNDRTQISAVLNFFDGYIQIWFLCVRICMCMCVCVYFGFVFFSVLA